MEWGVFLSRNGQTLYFSSSYQTGAFLDIKKSTWQDNGWGTAEPIPGHVNYVLDEEHVTLPADESFLILTSGRYAPTHIDLWLSTFSDGEWSELEAIEELNYIRNENGASLMPDGNTVYFASERIDSNPYNSQLYVSHRTNPVEERTGDLRNWNEIRVFPNPTNGNEFTIELGSVINPNSVRINLFDILGRSLTVSPESVPLSGSTGRFVVQFQNSSSGRYWLQLSDRQSTRVLPITILK
jgi:hypothetical protein